MLSPLSPQNSPPPVQRTGKKTANLQELFQFHAVAFLYLKREKQWKELGEGVTRFSFDRSASAIVVTRGDQVNHRVPLQTKVQNQVASSQSWVFRAVHCASDTHDVLCLQLPDDAPKFVERYEKHRADCLQAVENSKSNVNLNRASSSSMSNSSNTTCSSISSTEILNYGSDLSNGFRSIALRATLPTVSRLQPASSPQQQNATTTNEPTSAMRRRLSTYGGDFAVDGYAPGARNEDRMIRSPTQKSPLRPSQSGTAKTLRAAVAVQPTVVTFCGVSVKGVAPYNPDKQNQDALILHQMPSGEILFSVFDGHGEAGRTVSQHFRNQMPRLLASSTNFGSCEHTGQALKDALNKAERDIVDDVHVDTTLSGTTGVVAVIRGQKLFVANVGDSRAIFGMQSANSSGSRAYIARDITLDHKPDLPEEQKRIQDVGGRVFAVRFDDGIDGPARVWLSYAELPGLAMSRSLGDTIAKEAGVISVPDLYEADLTSEHKFLIMASDGLWEFMSSQEVVDIVAKYAQGPNPNPEGAIEELVEESARRWRNNEPVIDDTSIIVAFFN